MWITQLKIPAAIISYLLSIALYSTNVMELIEKWYSAWNTTRGERYMVKLKQAGNKSNRRWTHTYKLTLYRVFQNDSTNAVTFAVFLIFHYFPINYYIKNVLHNLYSFCNLNFQISNFVLLLKKKFKIAIFWYRFLEKCWWLNL